MIMVRVNGELRGAKEVNPQLGKPNEEFTKQGGFEPTAKGSQY